MSFLKTLFGRANLNGERLVDSTDVRDYAHIDLLMQFEDGLPLHETVEQQRWNRVLTQSYEEIIRQFEKQGWLEQRGQGEYRVTPVGLPLVVRYRQRLAHEKETVMPAVRRALAEGDTGLALSLRRRYDAGFPLGKAGWTGPEPQLSHSALTRRILFMDHWLLQGLSVDTVDWLKLYAAEQHLWGANWRLTSDLVPGYVRQEMAKPAMDGVEATYWKAYQLGLYVDNQETWQRCRGGDHVRRIEISGPDDEYNCDTCRSFQDQEYLVARVPKLPHRDCTSPRGCRCRYEPVLDSYGNLEV